MKNEIQINVNELTPTKFALEIIADQISQDINEGKYDPLNVAVKFSALENLSKFVKDKILSNVLEELGKYPKRKAELLGATISDFESVKYDYSHIEEWNELEIKINELKEKQKAIEDHQKKYFRGELPVKSASNSYKITLGK